MNPNQCTTPACLDAALKALEASIGRNLAFSGTYYGWSNISTNFPSLIETDDATVGRYPLVAWGCSYSNASVAAGTHDADIVNAIAALRSYGHPIFLRWEWEMNLNYSANSRTGCYNQGTGPNDPTADGLNSPDNLVNPGEVPANFFSPSNFIAAWRHIHQMFQTAGVTNVVWVWNPSNGTGGPPEADFYPGDAYVDWLGIDAYDSAGNPTATYLATAYANLSRVTSGKPLLLGETGVPSASQAAVFPPSAAALQSNFPNLKAYVYFDATGPNGNWAIATPVTPYANFGLSTYMMAPGPSPIPSGSASASPAPTSTPTANPSASPTATPSATPVPTATPTLTPTPSPYPSGLLCLAYIANVTAYGYVRGQAVFPLPPAPALRIFIYGTAPCNTINVPPTPGPSMSPTPVPTATPIPTPIPTPSNVVLPGLYYGNGVPTFPALGGSIYLRLDGYTGARWYANTSGAGITGSVWTAFANP